MFSHEGAVRCHDLSWPAMRTAHIRQQFWACGHRLGPDIPSGFPGFRFSASVPPLDPSSLRSRRRRAERGEHCRWRRRRAERGGTLIRAYRARAWAPVGAGAVRAPDCACEPARASQARDARLPSVPSVVFFAPAPARREAAPDAATLYVRVLFYYRYTELQVLQA